ncbi:MAG: hypothetical protein K1W22_16960 [Lachnospiraceae bacterium]
MGFWDREVRDGFDAMFDFNRDGQLDPFEQAMQFDFIEEGMKSESGNDEEEDDLFGSDLDFDELEDMDEDERREALEEAGYDPDDFDDF